MRGFTTDDRCDRCGAQAWHIATKPGCTDLMFCNHHHHEHKDGLMNQNWRIDSDISPAAPVPVAALTE